MDWIAYLWGLFLRHAYVVVFLATIVDATGLPFPGRLLLVAAGAYAATGALNLPALIALGALGASIGDHLLYVLGSLGGDSILAAICRIRRLRVDCFERAMASYRRFGAPVIVLARFSTAIRIVISLLVQKAGIGYPRFLAWDLAGAFLWSATWVLLGYVLGDRWPVLAERLGPAQAIGIALVLAAIAAIWLLRPRLRRARKAPL